MRTATVIVMTILSLSAAQGCPTARASEPRADFDGDRRADLFLRNPFSGGIAVWLTTGSSISQKVDVATISPATGWAPLAMGDVDGDGRTDLLWRNTISGELSVWLMSGGSVAQTPSLGAVAPSSGWLAMAAADFNNDGRQDLLWLNSYSGEIDVWLLNGATVSSASVATMSLSSGWSLLAVDDFNGDGRADLLWRNSVTGDINVWLMDGTAILSSGSLGSVAPATGWVPFAVADVSGDKKADILWYNGTTGDINVWLLDGMATPTGASYGNLAVDSGWTAVGTGDFNGDGAQDILWYNTITYQYVVWYLNGNAVTNIVSLGAIEPSSGWTIIGSDDFNGDGTLDMLWYNAFDYSVQAWLMSSGGGVLQVGSFGKLPAPSIWQVGG